ncbi:Putative amidase domain-containing protein [Evansella caseinilytica]|uniref:Putative amidase domain-containing protein n=1 Tax=Evansella caseinilytica TaxID=1503961 RepID=A0A1H3TCW5_9BACI|nr:amidase domain-containing protein [Evansella caseinilytica]SDZ48092.1 Putative amidase domain-containing protein [Evansella caseinilytica]
MYQLDRHLGEDSEFFDDLLDMTIGELKKEIDLRNAAEEELEEQFNEMDLQISPLSTYNRSKAAEYAKKYATKSNPNYKRYNSNCTNFVSQAVHAGGKKEKKPSSVNRGITETTKYWYNDDSYDCNGNNCYWRTKISTSWIRVKDFYTYWLNKGMDVTTSANKNTIVNNAKVGDVIQFKNKSGWYHSVIVTKKANGTVYISSNTKDYYNEDFKDKSAVSFRVINIK